MDLAITKFTVFVFFTAAKGLPAKLANKARIIVAIIPQFPAFQFHIAPSDSNDSHASEKKIPDYLIQLQSMFSATDSVPSVSCSALGFQCS